MEVRSVFQQSYDETGYNLLVGGVERDELVPWGVSVADGGTVGVCASLEEGFSGVETKLADALVYDTVII